MTFLESEQVRQRSHHIDNRNEMSLNIPIVISLGIYGFLMLLVSLYWMRQVKSSVDFLMGGRRLPFWVQAGTFTATGIGTGVTIGAAGLAYRSGWAGFVYPAGIGIGLIFVGVFFSRMRRYRFMTLSEEIACYYNKNKIIFEFANLSLFLSQVFWMTVQIMGGGFVLSVVTGLSIPLCMLITGGLIAVTALPGGLLTVVYTDVIQAVVLFFGFLILAFIALQQSGGLGELHESVPAAHASFLGIESVGIKTTFAIFLALSLSIVADPCRRLIIYSGKSESGATKAAWIGGVTEIFFAGLVVIVGLYAYSINPNIEKQDQALPWLVAEVMPVWLACLVVIAITAAVFSSGNSNAAASGTFFIRHIFPMITGRQPERPLAVARWSMVGVFIAATTMALFAQNIVDFVVDALSVVTSGLAVIIIMGRFWNKSTWQGGLAALVVAAGVSLVVIFTPSFEEFWGRAIIPATLFGFITHVAVSLLTQSKRQTFEEIAESLVKEREKIDRVEKVPG